MLRTLQGRWVPDMEAFVRLDPEARMLSEDQRDRLAATLREQTADAEIVFDGTSYRFRLGEVTLEATVMLQDVTATEARLVPTWIHACTPPLLARLGRVETPVRGVQGVIAVDHDRMSLSLDGGPTIYWLRDRSEIAPLGEGAVGAAKSPDTPLDHAADARHSRSAIMRIAGWSVWVVGLLLALIWTYGCITYARNSEQGVSYVSINLTLMWWLAIGWTLVQPSMSKLHLLWIFPAAWILAMTVTISRALGRLSRSRPEPPDLLRMLLLAPPPGCLILLCGEAVLLWWLS